MRLVDDLEVVKGKIHHQSLYPVQQIKLAQTHLVSDFRVVAEKLPLALHTDSRMTAHIAGRPLLAGLGGLWTLEPIRAMRPLQ